MRGSRPVELDPDRTRAMWEVLLSTHIAEKPETQQAIADRMGISRATVQRLLAEGERDYGQWHAFAPVVQELSYKLRHRYNLDGAEVVLGCADMASLARILGAAGANYFERLLWERRQADEEGDPTRRTAIAIGGGRTLAGLAGALQPGRFGQLDIIPMYSGPAQTVTMSPLFLAAMMALKYGLRTVSAFDVTRLAPEWESRNDRLLVEEDPEVIQLLASASIVITGIGTYVSYQGEALYQSNTLAAELKAYDIEDQMRRMNAVTDIGLNFIRKDGTWVDELLSQIPKLKLHQLQNLAAPNSGSAVLMVAGGPDKLPSLRAALKPAARLFSHLVTDEDTAEALLSEDD
jgi:DNA-binding transcriptional regulator LsrR (DeoR family)